MAADIRKTDNLMVAEPELLAPAGSVEAMKAALTAGADAVYIGGSRFGARAYADNPDTPQLLEAIDLAHRLDKKLYLTVNTLLRDDELEKELYDWMLPIARHGLDSAIIQDFGVADLLHRHFPDLRLHASTQTAVTGPAGAKLLQKLGFCRVVPARELSLEEVREIRTETGMEVETFIHGALCYSYSGQCLMSSLIGGRSGNRGRCAGVCRLPFSGQYPLSMKDLCTVRILPDLLRAGICSFKIEGRMKKPEYTAGVTAVYRKYLDLAQAYLSGKASSYTVEPADEQRLLDLFNRDGFTQGYYFERNGADMIALNNEKTTAHREKQTDALYASISELLRQNRQKLQAPVSGRLTLHKGEPARLELSCKTSDASCCDQNRADPKEVCPGNMASQSESCNQNDGLLSLICIEGPTPEAAKSSPLSEERVRKQMQKTGEDMYYFRDLQIDMDPDLFLPMQALSTLRRSGFAALNSAMQKRFAARALPYRSLSADEPASAADAATDAAMIPGSGPAAYENAPAAYENAPAAYGNAPGGTPRFRASVETEEQLACILEQDWISGIDLPVRLMTEQNLSAVIRAGKTFRAALPHVCRMNNRKAAEKAVRLAMTHPGADGILVRNLEEAGICLSVREEFAQEEFRHSKPAAHAAASAVLTADAGLYTMNRRAEAVLHSLGFDRTTMPLELNSRQMRIRGGGSTELVIYGRAPMMISAQCVQKTLQGCDRGFRQRILTDRMGKQFPVACFCDSCYNVIYNSLPTSLLQDREAAEETGAEVFRLEFSVETGDETAETCRAFRAAFTGQDSPDVRLPFPTTRGHFRRGVE